MERDSPESSPVKSCASSPIRSAASSPLQSGESSPAQSVQSSPFVHTPAVREFPPSPFLSPLFLSPADHHNEKRIKLDSQVSYHVTTGQHCRNLFNDGQDLVNNNDNQNSGNRDIDDERRSLSDELDQNLSEVVEHDGINTPEVNNIQEEVPTQDAGTESSSEEDPESNQSSISDDDSCESSEEGIEDSGSSSSEEERESEREESSSDDASSEFVSPKIHDLSDLTVDEGVVTLMNLFTKHKMSKVVMGSILHAVLQFMPKSSNFPRTQHALFNHVLKQCPVSEAIEHFYCSKCLMYLNLGEIDCHPCAVECHKFYQIPLADQVRNLFEKHGLADAIDKYLEERNSADSGGTYSDMLDGSEFKRARINGPYNLTLMGHTDGISISDSSDASLWPLEWVAAEFPPHLRSKYMFISGIWVDECKPYMNTMIKPFVQELQKLNQHGVQWVHPKTKEVHVTFIAVPSFCADSPARAQLQNILLHGGRHCCQICEQKMKKLPPQQVLPGVKRKARRRVFMFEENEATLRTADRMEAQGRKTRRMVRVPGDKVKPIKGVKGPSKVSDIPGCDRSTAFFPEYMHLLLCIIKQFMTLWFEKSGPWSLQEHWDFINNFLKSIRVPDFITRIPRSALKFTKWKANELRNFVLYFSVIILSKCMTPVYFQHWLLFVSAIYLLLQEQVSQNDVTRANTLLRMFCRDFSKLYPPSSYTYYIHNILHLARTVERHGPLHVNSAFMFESFNGTLAKYVHGSKNQAKELVNNVRLALGVEVLKARCLGNNVKSNGKGIEFKNQIHAYKFHEIEFNILSANDRYKEPLKVYFRALINHETFTCSLYTRQTKRNNFTINYLNSAGSKVFGEIRFFCATPDDNLALVEKFKIDHLKTFCHEATGILIKHIIPILRTGDYEVIELSKIISKVIRVDSYVCLRPNKYEYNL